jgi:hypothetical protein
LDLEWESELVLNLFLFWHCNWSWISVWLGFTVFDLIQFWISIRFGFGFGVVVGIVVLVLSFCYFFIDQAGYLGTVIINIQRTPLDVRSSIRVWAKLDDAFQILAAKLGMICQYLMLRFTRRLGRN